LAKARASKQAISSAQIVNPQHPDHNAKGAYASEKPSKKDLARMKAMNEPGESPTSIADRMRRSRNTVINICEVTFIKTPQSLRWSKTSRRKNGAISICWARRVEAGCMSYWVRETHDPDYRFNRSSFQQRRLIEGKALKIFTRSARWSNRRKNPATTRYVR
jgi:hypothetical protein